MHLDPPAVDDVAHPGDVCETEHAVFLTHPGATGEHVDAVLSDCSARSGPQLFFFLKASLTCLLMSP